MSHIRLPKHIQRTKAPANPPKFINCRDCYAVFPIEMFPVGINYPLGVYPMCIPCRTEIKYTIRGDRFRRYNFYNPPRHWRLVHTVNCSTIARLLGILVPERYIPKPLPPRKERIKPPPKHRKTKRDDLNHSPPIDPTMGAPKRVLPSDPKYTQNIAFATTPPERISEAFAINPLTNRVHHVRVSFSGSEGGSYIDGPINVYISSSINEDSGIQLNTLVNTSFDTLPTQIQISYTGLPLSELFGSLLELLKFHGLRLEPTLRDIAEIRAEIYGLAIFDTSILEKNNEVK